jgi:hypothetical protein
VGRCARRVALALSLTSPLSRFVSRFRTLHNFHTFDTFYTRSFNSANQFDMAPHKPAVKLESQEVSVTKLGNDRVSKRPARGYHKFRNGLLNVAPKDDEKEL